MNAAAADDSIWPKAHDGVHSRPGVAFGEATRAPYEQAHGSRNEEWRQDGPEDLPLARIKGNAVRHDEQCDGEEDFCHERVGGRHVADGAGGQAQRTRADAIEDERAQDAAGRLRRRVH